MWPYYNDLFGNAASRNHPFGWQAEEAVDLGREQVAALVGADPKEIVFVSGATEADNLALKGVYEAYGIKGNHFITVATEHKAVLDTCNHLEKMGGSVTLLGVDRDGLINTKELEAAIKPTTVLISVMYANNETGVIQPVSEISAIARSHGVLFFTDAAQALGKVPMDVNRDGIDLMAMSAHKIYGPKGIGAIYVRRKNPRVRLSAQIDGGGHEKGMRSGTLNVPGIAGFGKACELCGREMEKESVRLAGLRDRLESSITSLEGTYVNGNRQNRLPHVTNISFKYADGDALMMGINKDIAVSTGSACTSASVEPSHVLKAMGLGDDLAHSSLRFGLGRFTSGEEVDFVIDRIKGTVNSLRQASPLWEMYKEGKEMNLAEWERG
jgi:cysteine desulfurase